MSVGMVSRLRVIPLPVFVKLITLVGTKDGGRLDFVVASRDEEAGSPYSLGCGCRVCYHAVYLLPHSCGPTMPPRVP